MSFSVSMEQLCQILVLADQLLIERLKQICEFHIANLSTTANFCYVIDDLFLFSLSDH